VTNQPTETFSAVLTLRLICIMSSESAPPSPKRRRTEENITAEQQPTPTHSKYWFDDGNVVLQAENTQFRVHRSMLSRHSHVLKDMFEIPQPENTEGHIIEGCPVVHLYDSSQDVEIVISIFYDNLQ